MSKLVGNCEKGLIFIVSAPAGTGKTTLVQRLANEFPDIVPSISYTTRKPRPREENGKDYFFVSETEFSHRIDNGEFLEHVYLYQDYYGTSASWVEQKLNEKKHVILTIDTQGALHLKDKIDPILIFLAPPNLEQLQQRLTQRGTESTSMIEKRLNWAVEEMKAMEHYDYCVVNDDLNVAYNVLRSIIIAEERRIRVYRK